MADIEKIRNGLIDKILTIKNAEFLLALDTLLSSSTSDTSNVNLTKEQIAMLDMSEANIKNGEFISQEAMDKRNLEWLDGM